jgi:hypothetical protein
MRSREEPREGVSSSHCCGSGRIGIILLDPDPHSGAADQDPFTEKTVCTGIAVHKIKFISDFAMCVKLG